ncbi:hypothetical protein Afil01_19880 [Actinorhabdospora filicis]|uniref:Uncharacterized protein n=1 Tax=Actinorhabdospora filicis TaxID=1785913 RepID=A0A9W6W964_9ACTN|nr:hypothetical protein [Actinorhabdospora filicis]GLZ77181.1 hypothetical protein Afil01_19880 [Actinorhabdospora filicis]
MRRFTRLLFSRYGLVGAIVLLIVVVLTISRLLSGTAEDGVAGTQSDASRSTGSHTPDDGVVRSSGLPTAEPAPSLSPGAQDILDVAGDFAAKWARPGEDAAKWHADLRPLSTEALTTELTDVPPEAVPTDRLLGEPVLSMRQGELAQVTVSAVGGTLRLGLTIVNGHWLVSSVDWERG